MKQIPDDYKNLVDLLDVYTEATLSLTNLQKQVDEANRDTVDGIKAEFISLQLKLTEADEAIKTIAERNPDWFKEKRTVETPYGSVKMTRTTEITAASADASITLIKAAGRTEFLRETTELDKEALDNLSDEELALFGIVRTKGESCKVTPSKVNLGQAVKKSETAAKKKEKK